MKTTPSTTLAARQRSRRALLAAPAALREIADRYGSLVKACAAIGVSRPTLTRWLTGERLMPPDLEAKLRAAGITPSWERPAGPTTT